MHLDLTFSLLVFVVIFTDFYLKYKMCSKRGKNLGLWRQQITGLVGETQC